MKPLSAKYVVGTASTITIRASCTSSFPPYSLPHFTGFQLLSRPLRTVHKERGDMKRRDYLQSTYLPTVRSVGMYCTYLPPRRYLHSQRALLLLICARIAHEDREMQAPGVDHKTNHKGGRREMTCRRRPIFSFLVTPAARRSAITSPTLPAWPAVLASEPP